ncbi:DUF1801 domain-containing protein [Pedobacter sp.]
MPTTKYTNNEQVTAHIAKLPKNIQPAVTYLRELMLAIDDEISEHIKWNSPAFYYSGAMSAFNAKEYKRDILVMNLRKDKIMCVLPTGMVIKNNTEILEGNYTDGRRIIYFRDLDDIQLKAPLLKNAIKEWLALVEK